MKCAPMMCRKEQARKCKCSVASLGNSGKPSQRLPDAIYCHQSVTYDLIT